MALSMTNLYLIPITPQFPNFAIQILIFRLKHTVPVVTHAMCNKDFTPLGYGALLAKNKRLGPKLQGVKSREHPKKLGPLLISATVEASD